MNTAYRQAFGLMTRIEREMFERMGGEIPRGVLTCVPEWYVPTLKDRVADEERLRKNRLEAAKQERCRQRKRRADVVKKAARGGTEGRGTGGGDGHFVGTDLLETANARLSE